MQHNFLHTSKLCNLRFRAACILAAALLAFPGTSVAQGIYDDNGLTAAGAQRNPDAPDKVSPPNPSTPVHQLLKSDMDPNALPVRVTKMRIDRPKYKNILMMWETAQEINNNYFEVQRSTDSREWTPLDKIYGKGNTNQVTSYEYLDDISGVLASGSNQVFYRLRQVDLDGREWISNAISMKLGSAKNSDHPLTIYPNPATDHVVVTGITDAITVMDLSGRVLGVKNTVTGSTELTGLATGVYFIRSGTETRKLVIE